MPLAKLAKADRRQPLTKRSSSKKIPTLSVLCKSGIYVRSVSWSLNFVFLRAHAWDSPFYTLQFYFRLTFFHKWINEWASDTRPPHVVHWVLKKLKPFRRKTAPAILCLSGCSGRSVIMALFLSSEPPYKIDLSEPPGKPGPWMTVWGQIYHFYKTVPPAPSSQPSSSCPATWQGELVSPLLLTPWHLCTSCFG